MSALQEIINTNSVVVIGRFGCAFTGSAKRKLTQMNFERVFVDLEVDEKAKEIQAEATKISGIVLHESKHKH